MCFLDSFPSEFHPLPGNLYLQRSILCFFSHPSHSVFFCLFCKITPSCLAEWLCRRRSDGCQVQRSSWAARTVEGEEPEWTAELRGRRSTPRTGLTNWSDTEMVVIHAGRAWSSQTRDSICFNLDWEMWGFNCKEHCDAPPLPPPLPPITAAIKRKAALTSSSSPSDGNCSITAAETVGPERFWSIYKKKKALCRKGFLKRIVSFQQHG